MQTGVPTVFSNSNFIGLKNRFWNAFLDWNQETQETSWVKPETYVMAADNELIRHVLKIQCVYRSKKARGVLRIKRGEKAAADDDSGEVWIKVEQADGKAYYFHRETK